MLRGSQGTRRSPRGVWGARGPHQAGQAEDPPPPDPQGQCRHLTATDSGAGSLCSEGIPPCPGNAGAGTRVHHQGRGGRVPPELPSTRLVHAHVVPMPRTSFQPPLQPCVCPETTSFCFYAHLSWLLLLAHLGSGELGFLCLPSARSRVCSSLWLCPRGLGVSTGPGEELPPPPPLAVADGGPRPPGHGPARRPAPLPHARTSLVAGG